MIIKPPEEAKIILSQNEAWSLLELHDEFPEPAGALAERLEESWSPNKARALAETAYDIRPTWVDLLDTLNLLQGDERGLHDVVDRLVNNSPAEIDDILELHAYWDWPIPKDVRELPITMAPEIGKFCLSLMSMERGAAIEFEREHRQATTDLLEFNYENLPRKRGVVEKFFPFVSRVADERHDLTQKYESSGARLAEALRDYSAYRKNFIGIMQILPDSVRIQLEAETPESPLLGQ